MRQALILRDRIPLSFFIFIIAGSFLAILGGVLFFHNQKGKVLARVYNELEIISFLKAEEVRKWRQEHIRDASMVSSIVPMNKSTFALDYNNNEFRHRLSVLMKNYDYNSIVIIDEKGRIRLRYPESDLQAITFKPLKEFTSSNIEFSDLHYSEDSKSMHIDVLIPIFPPDSTIFTKSGFIIIRVDPQLTLFPSLEVLSNPAVPAEILLVRQDGDSVTYLNHAQSLGGKFMKMPLSDHKLPAVMAVKGNEGIFEGHDYRNVSVLSYLKHIPDSPWSLVVKVDKDKALEMLYKQSVMVLIIVVLFISIFIGIASYLWKNQKTRFYKELSETKDKFVSIIIHDLTNPFATIAGYCDVLVRDVRKGKDENVLRFSEAIYESSVKAIDLLKNLRQWSKIQTNQIRLNLTKVNLSSLIETSIQQVKASADRKNIVIQKSAPDDLASCMDKQMIETVLRNLITNAVKYSNQGGKIIVNAVKDQNTITINVSDNGIGMNSDVLDKLFSAENNTRPGTMAETGTGLGLKLCKEFVEMHGGSISAESIEGQGSNFSFTIPDAAC